MKLSNRVGGLLLGCGAAVGMVVAGSVPDATAAATQGHRHGGDRVVDRPIASRGCGRTTDIVPGTTVTRTLVSGGLERSYLLHVPSGYDVRRKTPLILAFHGRGSSDADLEAFSGLSGLDAIVVYPEGLPTTGEDSWEGAPYAPASDDVLFTSDLLNSLQAELCVDPHRIDATGKSNGGGFTALLACRMTHRIAAFAPVAGAYYPQSAVGCAHSPAVPILEFHGTADPTMAYDGGISHGTAYPSIPVWLQGWVSKDRCRLSNEQSIGTDITVESWHGCVGNTEVEHVRVAGGGHTWPGELADSGPGSATQTVSATQMMWDFFQEHPLPRAG